MFMKSFLILMSQKIPHISAKWFIVLFFFFLIVSFYVYLLELYGKLRTEMTGLTYILNTC